MYDLERFSEALRRDFVPLLRCQGFEPCGAVFRRASGERIDVVSLQGSRSGRSCCIELGVHYTFLAARGRGGRAGKVSDLGLRHHDCAFRERLREAGEPDRWWSYGSDKATAEASAASLVDTYQRRAHLFFESFQPSPDEALVRADLERARTVGLSPKR
jgi:hypothetical protein